MKALAILAVLVGQSTSSTTQSKDEISSGTSLAEDCIRCICIVESHGCNPIGCRDDKGSLSCGYYQIKLPYYQDCGQPGRKPEESIEAAWKRCSDDYHCATTCVKAYLKRYSFKQCPGKGLCEKSSRLHNGGPEGCSKPSTDDHWNKVKACCDCS